MPASGRIFIARHGETVHNAARLMQGDAAHTPLTRAGFAQADAMGAALARWLGTRQELALHASPAGRALQTLAIVSEHLGADYHDTAIDPRLREIDMGTWGGATYRSLTAAHGDFICAKTGLFLTVPDGGESYGAVAERLSAWIADLTGAHVDRLVMMHGMSSRVLRGLLLALDPDPRFGVPIAPSLPQGSLVMIGGGAEKIIHRHDGGTRE